MGCQTSKGGFLLSLQGFNAFTALRSSSWFFFFAYSMARGQEETFASQDRRKRRTPLESPTVSSLVAAMSVEELRSFCQVLVTLV